MAASKVLIVDDEEDILWGLSGELSRQGLEVITASRGEEALDLLKKSNVDFLITDIRMPDISGVELLLKARELHPDLKVIVMTAYGSEDIKNEVMRKGAISYLEKPFDFEQLLSLLKQKEKEKGTLAEWELTEVLQLLSMEGKSALIRVDTPEGEGRIIMVDGEVYDSQLGDLHGEEAFLKILTHVSAPFHVEWDIGKPEKTIDKPLYALLLEAIAGQEELQTKEALQELKELLEEEERLAELEGLKLEEMGTAEGEEEAAEEEKKGEALSEEAEPFKFIPEAEMMGLEGEEPPKSEEVIEEIIKAQAEQEEEAETLEKTEKEKKTQEIPPPFQPETAERSEKTESAEAELVTSTTFKPEEIENEEKPKEIESKETAIPEEITASAPPEESQEIEGREQLKVSTELTEASTDELKEAKEETSMKYKEELSIDKKKVDLLLRDYATDVGDVHLTALMKRNGQVISQKAKESEGGIQEFMNRLKRVVEEADMFLADSKWGTPEELLLTTKEFMVLLNKVLGGEFYHLTIIPKKSGKLGMARVKFREFARKFEELVRKS